MDFKGFLKGKIKESMELGMLWWGGRGRSPRDREKSHPDGFRYRLLPSLFSLAWQLRSCGQLPAATQRVVGPSFCLLALSPPLLFPLLGLSVSICTLTYVQVFTREGWALCALPALPPSQGARRRWF